MKKKLSINVIDSASLKPMLNEVTSLVADAIKNTFGPYGHSTLIQTGDSIYSTKDGWHVMRNLRLGSKNGEYSAAINAIKKLIQDVAQSVVLNAGDGTTTSILAADRMNEKVSAHVKEYKLDSRTIENYLNESVRLINKQLDMDAQHITEKNMAEIIYQIALISTNWDEGISSIIRDIYVTTKNPIIKVEDSGSQKTFVKYIQGYDLVGELMLPNFYMNCVEKSSYEMDDPLVLMFNSPLGKKHVRPFVTLSMLVQAPIVLMAPNFDTDFISVLGNLNQENAARGKSPYNIIPCRYFAKSDVDKECAGDVASLLGTMVMSNQYDTLHKCLEALADRIDEQMDIFKQSQFNHDGSMTEEEKKEYDRIEEDKKALCAAAAKELVQIAGTCKHISISPKTILVTGFNQTNTEEFERRRDNLKALLKQKYEQYNAESSMTESIRIMRIRLGKMECNMGVIYVGGHGKAHLIARKDAIDDATRACEVAYTGGYIVDGGLAIARAAYKAALMYKNDDKYPEIDVYLKMFLDSFSEVCTIMYNNKYNNIEESNEIVNHCITDSDPNMPLTYNLVTEKYSSELISPVDVCKEIVSACLRLVLVNCTSNQFVYLHQDDIIRAIEKSRDYEEPEDDTVDEDDEE